MKFRLVEDIGKKTIKAYHGTDSVFNRFKNIKGGIGYWFSTDKDYANEHGNYLLEVLLHLSNVLDLEVQEDEFLNLRDEFFGKRVDEKTIFSSKEFGNFLSSKGYDAMSWSHNDGTTYVVFNPDDIEIKRTLREGKMKILKEDIERVYKFKCYYSSGRNYIIDVKADDIITAWGNLGDKIRHWVIGFEGYLENVELMGDYSNEYDAYVSRR